MTETLEKLCLLGGISGDEGAVREYILSRISDKCKCTVDPLGNLIAFVPGTGEDKKKIMISAHMDEVGFIVTYITPEGLLKIAPVGGIDPAVTFGIRVNVGRDRLPGVIGGVPVHHVARDDRRKPTPIEELYVDIGAGSREEAEKYVSLGDSVTYEPGFDRYGDGFIRSKALDDRVGCAIMIEMILNGSFRNDMYFTFVVQEEIGLRGSGCAAFTVEPDIAIVLETTTAADIPSASGEKRVCGLGKGPVVSFMDRRTIYDKELYERAFASARALGIPCQTKTMVAGGNDAGAIQVSRGGVKVCAVSLPARYLHSPGCVIKESDLYDSYKLVMSLV